eukprot:11887543-Ditylum_brightwellii.AAC.1
MPSVPYFTHQNDEIFQVGAYSGVEDLKVTVSGDPRQQKHTRVTRTAWNRSGHVHAYNPDATHVHNFRRAIETVLGLTAFTSTPPAFARAADLKLTVLFQVCCPKSQYRAGRLVSGAPIYPTNADIDNYVKFIMDAMQSIIYYDDCRIHIMNSAKIFTIEGHVGRTFIHIQKI